MGGGGIASSSESLSPSIEITVLSCAPVLVPVRALSASALAFLASSAFLSLLAALTLSLRCIPLARGVEVQYPDEGGLSGHDVVLLPEELFSDLLLLELLVSLLLLLLRLRKVGLSAVTLSRLLFSCSLLLLLLRLRGIGFSAFKLSRLLFSCS